MSKKEIGQIVTHYKDAVTKAPGVEYLLRNVGHACLAKFQTRMIKAYSALVTWNGPWGLIPYPGLVKKPTPEHNYAMELEEVAQYLLQHKKFKALWDGFDERMQAVRDTLKVHQMTCALEVCKTTLRQDRVVRVRAHAFLV